ncbi:hypothetical protein ACFLZY_01105 [Patescibacteria group bacterium]
MFKNLGQNQKGVSTLAVTVVIFFVALLLAISIHTLGLGELTIGFTQGQGEKAFQIAQGCQQEALYQLRQDPTYPGAVLSLDDASCTIEVSSLADGFLVEIKAQQYGFTRQLLIELESTDQGLTLLSWQENSK